MAIASRSCAKRLLICDIVLILLAAAPAANAGTYTVLYSFKGGSDGLEPDAALTMVDGTLFGTTAAGGLKNGGTAFKLPLGGTLTVIHRFDAASEGREPSALVPRNGLLYGTTRRGGPGNVGTAFSITHKGAVAVLHGFGAAGDGRFPFGNLIKVGPNFLGMAILAGPSQGNLGTVFALDARGNERLLNSVFTGPILNTDPTNGLVNDRGLLYGATRFGGTHRWGSLFKMNLAGETKILHSFDGLDGSGPMGCLIIFADTLYGTTSTGGANGSGTAFAATPPAAGKPSVLTTIHSFGGTDGNGQRDGEYAYAGLVEAGGTLYGITTNGGTYGLGTVFALTPPATPGGAWTETVVHAFAGSDGEIPRAELINVDGTLYGTTTGGGVNGYGTVFSLVP